MEKPPVSTDSISIPTPSPTYVYYRSDYQEKAVYQLEPGGSWSVRVQPMGTHLVWEMNYNVMREAPMAKPLMQPRQEGQPEAPPAPSSWKKSYVHALVDARTGAIIRLSRPAVVTVTPVRVEAPAPGYGVAPMMGDKPMLR
jgi:hypothetical protein